MFILSHDYFNVEFLLKLLVFLNEYIMVVNAWYFVQATIGIDFLSKTMYHEDRTVSFLNEACFLKVIMHWDSGIIILLIGPTTSTCPS